MKNKKNPLKLPITVAILIAAAVLLVKSFQISDLNVISPGILYASAQPRGMDYTRLLYKYHIATIINLRSPAEHRERNWHNEEITWVRSNGVKYFEMPLDRDISVPGHFPDAKMQEQLLAIMADKANLPVLVHDSSGESRVAMLSAIWLARGCRLPAQQVIETASEIKKSPLTDLEKQFINDLAK